MSSSMATTLRLGVAVVLCFVVLQNRSAIAEEVLRNQDVLKLVSAGLSEEVITAKIREAPQVEFQLTTDDLVALRKAGVSDRVVSTMLERSKPVPRNPAHPARAVSTGVSLRVAEGILPLRMVTGEVSPGWYSAFMNYPGLQSTIRTRDRRPVLLVNCPYAPAVGHYFFAKLDRDRRRGVRSLKLGQAVKKAEAPGGRLAPDSSWVLPFDVQEDGPGTWRITLKSDLEPGEYSWYVNLPDPEHIQSILDNSCFTGGSMFDFGID
jgi:hypothetical protein